jgi:hypothetical protein
MISKNNGFIQYLKPQIQSLFFSLWKEINQNKYEQLPRIWTYILTSLTMVEEWTSLIRMDLQLYVLYLLERHIAQTAAIQCRGVSKKTIFYTYLPNTKCSLNENTSQKLIHYLQNCKTQKRVNLLSLKSKTDCRQIIQKQ